tara:strand:+ start:799 stop:1083 length:285 start_codon:yes stop_codon:yes gene_type:complete
MKVGDIVYLKDPFWLKNENLGNKKGIVISTKSYILVNLYSYHSNPVKCFRNEVTSKEPLKRPTTLTLPDRKDFSSLSTYLDDLELESLWDFYTD